MMKKLFFAALAIAILQGCGKLVPTDHNLAIVPKPVQLQAQDGVFELSGKTPICTTFEQEELSYATAALNEIVQPIFGKALTIKAVSAPQSDAINIMRNKEMADEQYSLSITPSEINITAGGAAGVFYAIQTIRQLIPINAFSTKDIRAFELPAVTIDDQPTMGYRGFMFDVARHFFSVDDVKRALDIVALHKMNIFHWHLTDDQGWRIEIKKYPRLTEIGSIRKQTVVGHNSGTYDGIPHGGFYTQEQIKDVVAYAKERFITVIPEIEIPGHSVAALTAYPELGCTGKDYEVLTQWGVDDRVLCIGKEPTFTFIKDVLSEVLELFPSKYIHIGGDECPTVEWEKCPLCQARMKAEGLKTERQLQGYTTKRVEEFLNERGRSLVGWDEILEGGVTPNATIMSWRGTDGGIQAAQQGNHAIMAPTTHCYLDYNQVENAENEPAGWGGYLPVEQVYALDPYANLSVEQRSYILGVQGNLWTEYITTMQQAEYMALPRLSAIAEVGWNYDGKNYTDYCERLQHLAKVYDSYGYNYAKHVFDNEKQ
ncbi:MAG: beta-N-acetylhexosaminidase [Alistipes sp.]